MSSPPALPLEPPALPSSSAPTPLRAVRTLSPTPPRIQKPTTLQPPPQLSRDSFAVTLIPPISPSRNDLSGSDSEAETVVLNDEIGDGDRHDSKTEDEDDSEYDATRRPRRRKGRKMEADNDVCRSEPRVAGVVVSSGGRRSTRGAAGKAGGAVGGSRIGRGERRYRETEVDDEYSSDLSSVPSRSSRPVSPSAPHVRHAHASKHTNYRASKKRKILDTATTTSSDDNEDLGHRNSHHRPRRRRNTHTIESSPPILKIKSSPPVSPVPDSSPIKVTRTRAAQTGHKVLKHRKVPPPLDTAKERNSGDERSSSSSRNGSPSDNNTIRVTSIRTPGSPINMAHKPKRDTAGRTTLHKACQRGAVADVIAIIDQNREFLNEEDNAGYMPLHEACLHGHLEVVRILTNAGAWVDVPSRLEQDTPLLDAVNNGHTDVVKFMLELGADPRKRNKLGQTAMDVNEAHNLHSSPEVFQEIDELLRAAINKLRNKRQSDDENNNRASVPADSHSSRDPSVASPVHQSPPAQSAPPARRRNARTEQSRKDLLWLDAGKNGIQKLREKAREGDEQMVHALLERGTKPDTESLIGAIKGGHTDTVSLLLAYNAFVDPEPGPSRDGNRRNRDGSLPVGEETPMNAAIGRGNLDILRYLLENGANPRRLDSRGKSYSDIAIEREGELWQEEAKLLRCWWDKAEGLNNSGKSTDKLRSSPSSHRRSSPRPKKNTGLKRNPSTSRRPDTPSTSTLTNGSSTCRSASANPSSSKCEDVAATSDNESVAEPLGPPKNRGRKPRRSESESVPPVVAKRKRRLVSGRDLEESTKSAPQEPDSDVSEKSNGPSRSVEKRVERKLKAETQPQKPDPKPTIKTTAPINTDDTPTTNTTKADAAERNSKLLSNQRDDHLAPKADVNMQRRQSPIKRDRTRSPLRAHSESGERSDQEETHKKKRRVEEHSDDHPLPRYDSDNTNRRVRDDKRRDEGRRRTEDPPKQRDAEESRRPLNDEDAAKESRRRRLEVERLNKEREAREREKRERDRRETEKREQREREREKREAERREEQNRRAQKEFEEARERKRQEVLTAELASIQAKARREREDAVIARELALRKQREEREAREKMEREEREERERKEQEEREAKARAEAEAKKALEKEAMERELRERQAAKEIEEREARAREARKLEALEREARERELREEEARKARQKEKEKRERETREKEAEQKRLAELKRREEEKKREEEERRWEEERRCEEERRKEQERKREEEALERERERRRQEAEKEKQRKLAEEERRRQEIQWEKEDRERKEKQLAAAEKRRLEEAARAEVARIEALPYALRELTKNQMRGIPHVDWNRFLPMKTATFESAIVDPAPHSFAAMPNSNVTVTNGTKEAKGQKYVSNIQAALALGLPDISFSAYRDIKRRSASEHEKRRMWGVLNVMVREPIRPGNDRPYKELVRILEEEKEKFLGLTPVFWIKLEDFKRIVHSDVQHKHLVDKLNVTVEIDIECLPPGSRTKEETERRQSSWGKSSAMRPPPGNAASTTTTNTSTSTTASDADNRG
ncbi:hypothetical protein RUND412_010238 [Rhizina undulata]